MRARDRGRIHPGLGWREADVPRRSDRCSRRTLQRERECGCFSDSPEHHEASGAGNPRHVVCVSVALDVNDPDH